MIRPDAALRVAARCLLFGVGLVAAVLVLGAGPAHADLRGTLGQAGRAAETTVSSTSKVTSTVKKVKAPLSSVRHTVHRTVHRDAVRQTVDQPVRRAVTTVRHRNVSAAVVRHVRSSGAPQVRRTPVVQKVVQQPTTKKTVQKTAGQVQKTLAPAGRAVERAVPTRTGKAVVDQIDQVSTTVKAVTGRASAATATLHGITTPVLELLAPIVREVTPEITSPSVSLPTVRSSITPALSVPGTLPVTDTDQPAPSLVSVHHRVAQPVGTTSLITRASGSRGGGFSVVSVPTVVRIVDAQGHLDASGPAVGDRLETTAPTSPTLTGATGSLSASSGSVLWCSTPPAPPTGSAGAAVHTSTDGADGAWHLTRDPGFSPD